MIDWQLSKGTVFRIAPPYIIIVPQAYPEAMNLNMPEYFLGTGAYRRIALITLCLLRQSVLRLHALGGSNRAFGCDPAYAQSNDDTII